MLTLFRKELRDVIRWTPIGMILVTYLAWTSLPAGLQECQNPDQELIASMGIGLGLIALALGMLQSLPDLRNDVRGFLLHRPVSQSTIFRAKILAGLAAYSVCVVPALILIAVYLEVKGPEQLPTAWTQVIPVALAAIGIFALHPAAMWTACREARWTGTRLFPLVFTAAGVFVTSGWSVFVQSLMSFVGFVCVTIFILALTLMAASHAFRHQTHSPPVNSPDRMSMMRAIGLFIAGVILYCGGGTFIVELLRAGYRTQSPLESTVSRLALNNDGKLWELRETRDGTHPYQLKKVVGRPVDSETKNDTAFAELPQDWRERKSATLPADLPTSSAKFWFSPSRYLGHIRHHGTGFDWSNIWDFGGRLFVYKETRGLTHVITPKGIYNWGEKTEGFFTQVNLQQHLKLDNQWIAVNGSSLLYDVNGIYQLDSVERRVTRLSETGVRQLTIMPDSGTQKIDFWSIEGKILRRFQATPLDQNIPVTAIDAETVKLSNTWSLPAIKFTRSDEWTIDVNRPDRSIDVAVTADGTVAVVRPPQYPFNRDAPYEYQYQLISDDKSTVLAGTTIVAAEDIPAASAQGAGSFAMMACVPPATVIGILAYEYIQYGHTERAGLTIPLWFTLVLLFIPAVAAWWYSGRLGLPGRVRFIWGVVGSLAGLGTLLGMLAIYPKPVRQRCPHCERQRRIDTENCEFCGGDWPMLEGEGIEIYSSGGEVALAAG